MRKGISPRSFCWRLPDSTRRPAATPEQHQDRHPRLPLDSLASLKDEQTRRERNLGLMFHPRWVTEG
jgi:hypothetical protein